MNLSYLRQSFLALYTLCHISSVWMRSLFFKLSFADASRIPVISEAEAEHSKIESTNTTGRVSGYGAAGVVSHCTV